MKSTFFSLILFLTVSTCSKHPHDDVSLKKKTIELPGYSLQAYYTSLRLHTLVVFESGLGDGHSVWLEKNIPDKICNKADIMVYDRAGYENSQPGTDPRNISNLSADLDSVIRHISPDRKVILVGHSLGGLIIRDYAIKNPSKVAAMLFVDPTHEGYNKPTQSIEDQLYGMFNDAYGQTFGGTMEIRQIIEDLSYASALPNLPDVPVTVITSMKADDGNNQSDSLYGATRQAWYTAHDSLGNGISDFTHITTTKSGHYIMRDEPELVIESIKTLLSKSH